MTDAARRLLLVHAHPDDETLTTGGTIARYVAEGAEVTVLTCTLGEEGEVIGDDWAELVADRADQLGGYRILELTRALAAQYLLARCGEPSELHIGAARTAERGITAHAWLAAGGRVVIGAETMERYLPLTWLARREG